MQKQQQAGFQPKGRTCLNPHAREFFPPGYHHANTTATAVSCHHAAAAASTEQDVNNSQAAFLLGELPMEILSCVLGFLRSPQDLLSCILASQQLQSAMRSARVSFELTGQQAKLLSFPASAGVLDAFLRALTSYLPAMSACNLSMLPLEHRHISQLVQGLPLLQHLDLSGCKKLKPEVTQQLLQGLASKQLLSLNLQRCFQLTDTCLTDVLEYACAAHSSSKALQCIALSHLNLSAWPAAAAGAPRDRQQQGQRSSSSSGSSHDVSADDSDDGGSSSGGMSTPATLRSASRRSSSSDEDSSGDDTNNVTDSRSSSSSSTSGAVAAAAGSFTGFCWHAASVARLLSRLPQQLPVIPLSPSASTAGLRVVVLNNCSLLPVEGLLSLAVACPQLEYLFLGGSTLKPLLPAAAAAAGAAGGATSPAAAAAYVPRSVAAAAGAASGSGAGGAAAGEHLLPPALQQLSVALQLPASLPWEVLSSCCDGGSCSSGSTTLTEPCSCSCSCCSNARIAQAHSRDSCSSRDGGGMEQERARKRLHRNEPPAAAVAVARGHALALAYVAALLPGLKALEVTFMTPGLAGWLRVCLDRLQQLKEQQKGHGKSFDGSSGSSSSGSSSSGSSMRPRVWQFTCVTAVADALQALCQARRVHQAQSSSSSRAELAAATGAATESNMLDPVCLQMAIKCAVNCSSRGRSTPLHTAADAGCRCHIRALLAAGAAVATRDASGASPLFVACESGRAAAAAVLLEAGADALVGNTAGETPLYIAALRGHLGVVEVLLGHLAAADVDWTQRQLYGDAWTPLMAAAVANRVDVAVCLLRAAATRCHRKHPAPNAAGPISSSNSSSAAGAATWVVGGCTAKACPGVMRLLVAENRYGQTVYHIAARKGCRELLQLLLLYGAGQVAGGVADAAGDTPLDIARRHGHGRAVQELLQQC